MEGQQLRDEINKVAARIEDLRGPAVPGGMAGLVTAADRPPALAFAVARVEREAQELVELAEIAEARLASLLHQAPDESSDRAIPERTGVQAPDRILEIADELGRARRRLLSTIDRVAV